MMMAEDFSFDGCLGDRAAISGWDRRGQWVGEPDMDREQAQRVRAGDVAMYRGVRHRVVAVYDDGFWAPYFELEGAGVVGHALIDSVEIQPVGGVSAGRPSR